MNGFAALEEHSKKNKVRYVHNLAWKKTSAGYMYFRARAGRKNMGSYCKVRKIYIRLTSSQILKKH